LIHNSVYDNQKNRLAQPSRGAHRMQHCRNFGLPLFSLIAILDSG
jgi:hypothetical protein